MSSEDEVDSGEETSMFDAEVASGGALRPVRDASFFEPDFPDPIDIAISRDWLQQDEADSLLYEAEGDSSTAIRLALEQGFIAAREYDVITALAGMRVVAPGYRVRGLLGQGGMGAVFLATQEALDRPVAIKTILVDTESQTEAIARFKQEATTIARLRHPNVITAYDFGSHAGRMFLAMELVDGKDLNTYLESGPINETQVWQIARQVAAALAAAVDAGVVHRDIKPANILLLDPAPGTPLPPGVPMVKVADFGLSLLQDSGVDRVTSANVAVGSPHYMAPELLSGHDATPATDMYALGATIFRCVSGAPPFDGKPLPAVIGEKLSGVVPVARNVPAESCSLIARMMAFDAETRPQSFIELIAAIDALIGGDVRPSISQTRQSKSATGTWRQVVLMIVAVIVTASVVTALSPPAKRPAPVVAKEPGTDSLLGSRFPDKVETGRLVSLFEGESLEGWTADTRFGDSRQWELGTGSEGEPLLSGQAGRYFRSFESVLANWSTNGTPVEHFRIEITIQKAAGYRAGVLFDLADDGPFYELILSEDRAEIHAFATADAIGEEVVSKSFTGTPIASAAAGKSAAIVRVDFCEGEWGVEANGVKLGPLKARVDAGDKLSPRFGLEAFDGEVSFSDVSFVELSMPDTASASRSFDEAS